MSTAIDALPREQGNSARDRNSERRVLLASSLGTLFEWYDFYLIGALAGVMAANFFSDVDRSTGIILTLLMFAAGFAVRPLGAIFFGRLGDLVGRKHTFLMTILIMGVATFLVGVLPTTAQIGTAAPILLVALRLLQGFALGGEYGGAATYVGEQAPQGRRGLFTSVIQSTATLGLLLALLVILVTRKLTGEHFDDWGWRIPFLLSIVLLVISVWIRLKLQESPVFRQLKTEGKSSKRPLRDAFGNLRNGRTVLLVLLGATAGQAVIWYTGQFYALFFLTQSLKVDEASAIFMVATALLLGTPFFIFFGWLSDHVGRKTVILAGCLIGALALFPAFKALTQAANPAIFEAVERNPVTLTADPSTCHLQFNPTGARSFTSECDRARAALATAGIPYRIEDRSGPTVDIEIGQARLTGFDDAALATALQAAGYPTRADPQRVDTVRTITIIWGLVAIIAMVYGPMAAWLVELFPTRIRYTSLSLPYHIGNGWLGGFLPAAAFAMVSATGDIYYGLWYPVIVASVSLLIGLIFLPETFRRPIDWDPDAPARDKARPARATPH